MWLAIPPWFKPPRPDGYLSRLDALWSRCRCPNCSRPERARDQVGQMRPMATEKEGGIC